MNPRVCFVHHFDDHHGWIWVNISPSSFHPWFPHYPWLLSDPVVRKGSRAAPSHWESTRFGVNEGGIIRKSIIWSYHLWKWAGLPYGPKRPFKYRYLSRFHREIWSFWDRMEALDLGQHSILSTLTYDDIDIWCGILTTTADIIASLPRPTELIVSKARFVGVLWNSDNIVQKYVRLWFC